MFKLTAKKNTARSGQVKTKNGVLSTPFFMPDATRGFVKSLDCDDLSGVGVSPVVVNTYHLYLQPGTELVKKAGGIHEFMNWHAPLLSDSGGYQVFSLIHKNPEMGKITDEAVIFKSPLDGSKHIISPEKSIQIQFDLGVDMMVVLDDVPPNTYTKEKIKDAVERTVLWAGRCKVEYEKQLKMRKIAASKRPLIFGVIQGGGYADLRKYCAEKLVEIGFDGYGFGARHIDADGNFMEDVVRETAKLIPENALRFALGVGTPADIVKFVECGWDMFDCVIPTREGRHGRLFLRKSTSPPTPLLGKERVVDFYETMNINNGKFREDFSPIDVACDCQLCKNYSRSYLHHLFAMKDPIAMRLAAMHNLKFYMDLMEKLREEIINCK
ncbi:MAG: tRNA guanosine(34) transglycosylase Tgt [Candidatus Moranbacteria bacterium]|nr:tRNA guanosine(34) transglycosylase Tgt [Candidatus Moranbacteria bacterium]